MKKHQNSLQGNLSPVRRLRLTSFGELPPQVALSDVETRLNMQHHNGLFEAASPDKHNGTSNENTIDSAAKSPPPQANGGGGESASSEWSSAVGHAMTGKSGRVIHNLQEDIARLTRECSLHRSRAEEAQKIYEALKQQLQSVSDRLGNAEQSNEANLNSIARKDRKIEDLKAELENEKKWRLKAEEDARHTNQLAAQERDEHHRAFTEAQETAHHARSQYDTLVRARSREQGEYQSRFKLFRKELDELFERETERQNSLSRLDVIIEQKNKEIEAGKDRTDRFEQLFREYKEQSDHAIRDLMDGGNRNDAEINKFLTEAKEVTDKMKWAMNVKENVGHAE